MPVSVHGHYFASAESGEADALEGAADGAVDGVEVGLDPAAAFERAIVDRALDAIGHRDRPLDRLDDVGEADPARRPGEAEAAAGAAGGFEQPGAGEPAHQLLRGRDGNARLLGEQPRRKARAGGAAGGGGHHDDGIIGKGGEAHGLIGPIRSDWHVADGRRRIKLVLPVAKRWGGGHTQCGGGVDGTDVGGSRAIRLFCGSYPSTMLRMVPLPTSCRSREG